MYVLVHTITNKYVLVCACMYYLVLDILCDYQANSMQSAGCVRHDINLLKPIRLKFSVDALAPSLPLPLLVFPSRLVGVYVQNQPPSSALAATKLAEWIGNNLQELLGFPNRLTVVLTIFNKLA